MNHPSHIRCHKLDKLLRSYKQVKSPWKEQIFKIWFAFGLSCLCYFSILPFSTILNSFDKPVIKIRDLQNNQYFVLYISLHWKEIGSECLCSVNLNNSTFLFQVEAVRAFLFSLNILLSVKCLSLHFDFVK